MKNQYYFRYNADPNEIKEEESLNLTSAIWFAWGVLLNSGQSFRASMPVIVSSGIKKFAFPARKEKMTTMKCYDHSLSSIPQATKYFFTRNWRGHTEKLLRPGAGHGVGGLRYDHRSLVHRQPRRLPRPRQAADQPHWYQ